MQIDLGGLIRDNVKVVGANPRVPLPTSPIIDAIKAGRTELWRHPNQVDGPVRSDVIQNHLTNTGLIVGCVRVYELQDIRDVGIDFFKRYFAGMTIYGRAIPPGATCISFLCESRERNDELLLGWGFLSTFLFANSPALRVLE